MTALPKKTWHTGFSSLGCAEFTVEAMLSLAQEFQIEQIEWRAIENEMNLPAYFARRYPDLSEVRKKCEAAGVQISCLNSSFKWVGPTDEARNEFHAFASLAEALGVPYVRVFGGGTWGAPLSEETVASATEEYRRWEVERERRGWKVQALIETHDAFSASKPILQLMERLEKEIPVLWDTHHTWKLGGESPRETWKQLGTCIVHAHIKESISKPSARHPFTYVLPGAGEFPATELYSVLEENHFSGTLSLEWERQWHPYLSDLKSALTEARKREWL